jgi:hypothetical protein
VSTVAGLLALAGNGQGGHLQAPTDETVLLAVLITGLSVACVFIAVLLGRRERRPRPVADHWQALTVMGELCPHGWQAQITLYGWGAPVPADAPPSRAPLVRLEWQEFDQEPGRVAVERRVWAPSIEEALQAMVDDRRTDVTFEEIERTAFDAREPPWID